MWLWKQGSFFGSQVFECFGKIAFLLLNFLDPLDEICLFLQQIAFHFNVFVLHLLSLLGLLGFVNQNALLKLKDSCVFLQFVVLEADTIDEESHESWSLNKDILSNSIHFVSLNNQRLTLGVS